MKRNLAFALLGVVLLACGGTDGSDGTQGSPGEPGAPGSSGAAGGKGDKGDPTPAPPTEAPKAVYTLSNDATFNEVFVYARAADGTLTPQAAYATGGRGAGAGLGDQGALVFDSARKAFFAVNAGDDSISMMSLHADGSLSLVSQRRVC